jgi:signal transduction histidine kinase/ActR/RegA family two-component response regulator
VTTRAAPIADRERELDQRRLQFFEIQQRQLRWPILAAVALVALVVARQVPWPLLVGWALVAVGVREWRSLYLARLVAETGRPIRQRLDRLVLSNVALGCSHGLAVLFMAWLDTTYAALLTAIVLGWTAGAVATSAPLPRAYVGYAACILGPLAAAWLVHESGLLGVGVALLVVLTAGAQFRFLRLNASLFEESFRIRLANEDLVRQLAGARDAAEAGSHAKSRFLAAASHDLRQPLHALMLQIGLLEADPHAPEAPEIVHEIAVLTRSLAKLLDSLLDISKLDAGVVTVDLRPIRLHRLLGGLVRAHEPQAAAKGLMLRLECPLEITVESDPLLLERVLRNLLDNALKYTERGEVAVVATAGSDGVTLAVRDTGRGIPVAAQPRVFEEFFQADAGGGRAGQGLGLGLSIVQRLATLLQMPLELQSEPGQGTTVTLRLPGATQRDDALGTFRSTAGGLRGTRVLVVDDEPAVRRAMRNVLERFGCETADVAGSDEALARLAGFEPDLVLADCRLRDGDSGLEAIRRLRERRPGLPAVLISGDTDVGLRRDAAVAGIELLHKPLTVERLGEAVAAALAGPEAADPVEPAGRVRFRGERRQLPAPSAG